VLASGVVPKGVIVERLPVNVVLGKRVALTIKIHIVQPAHTTQLVLPNNVAPVN
jgi:hypothetical protein